MQPLSRNELDDGAGHSRESGNPAGKPSWVASRTSPPFYSLALKRIMSSSRSSPRVRATQLGLDQ